MLHNPIRYVEKPPVSNEALNELFAAAWPAHEASDFALTLPRCLTYLCAYSNERLVGFVKVAWDGQYHGFLLDPTVHPELRRRGIGSELIRLATEATRAAGLGCLHVDYEPQLAELYRRCGFSPTQAGLIRLNVALA
jgi:ribosomal protein S18 acetylase RimI-like enzyme